MLTTASGGLSGQLQKVFDKRLLIAIRQELVHDQFVYLADLPKHKGGTQVRFTRPDAANRLNVNTVTAEGVEQVLERGMSYTFIDTTLQQIYVQDSISDVLSDFELFNTAKNLLDVMGADVGHRIDFDIVTEYVVNNTSRIYSGNTNFANLVADSSAAASISFTDLDRAFTKLTVSRAPKAKSGPADNDQFRRGGPSASMRGGPPPGAKGGTYMASVPTQVAFAIRLDSNQFIASGIRGVDKGLFNAEIGTWYGLRLLEHTQPWLETTVENTYNNSGTLGLGGSGFQIYTSLATGYQAVACVEVAGGSPFSPQTIIVDRPDSGNRLGLRKYVGLKAYEAIKTLNTAWSCSIRSKSSYS